MGLYSLRSWWRHQMETFSALLALCAGNSPVTGEFPSQRPVTRSFDVFFDLHLNKRLSTQSRGWWFETPSQPLWRHCNVTNVLPQTTVKPRKSGLDFTNHSEIWQASRQQETLIKFQSYTIIITCNLSRGFETSRDLTVTLPYVIITVWVLHDVKNMDDLCRYL